MPGLELWFPEDIRQTLASLASSASRYPESRYRQGYLDALADVGLAFGVVLKAETHREEVIAIAHPGPH